MDLEKSSKYIEYFPYYARTISVVGVLYLLWGQVISFLYPSYNDPQLLRVVIVGYVLSVAFFSNKSDFIKKNRSSFLMAFIYMATFHLGYLGHINNDPGLYHTCIILGAVYVGIITYRYSAIFTWVFASLIFPTYSLYTSFSSEKLIIILYVITAAISSAVLSSNRVALLRALTKKNEELEEQKAIAIHSSKLTAVGEIAAGVAHEINNPLTIINGNLDRIKKACLRGADTDVILHSTERAKNAVQRSKVIIDALRSFSRDTSDDGVAEFSLNKIANDSLDLVKNRFLLEDVDLRVYFSDFEPKVLVNEFEISQIVLNLLNNSFHAIQDLDEKWVELKTYSVGDQTYLRVIDSGQGIEDSIVEKLMNPFFTTKPSGVGTGLGLSISQNIARKYKGSLNYVGKESNTTFELTLPNLNN